MGAETAEEPGVDGECKLRDADVDVELVAANCGTFVCASCSSIRLLFLPLSVSAIAAWDAMSSDCILKFLSLSALRALVQCEVPSAEPGLLVTTRMWEWLNPGGAGKSSTFAVDGTPMLFWVDRAAGEEATEERPSVEGLLGGWLDVSSKPGVPGSLCRPEGGSRGGPSKDVCDNASKVHELWSLADWSSIGFRAAVMDCISWLASLSFWLEVGERHCEAADSWERTSRSCGACQELGFSLATTTMLVPAIDPICPASADKKPSWLPAPSAQFRPGSSHRLLASPMSPSCMASPTAMLKGIGGAMESANWARGVSKESPKL